jgi:hypothetical protein
VFLLSTIHNLEKKIVKLSKELTKMKYKYSLLLVSNNEELKGNLASNTDKALQNDVGQNQVTILFI